MMNNPPSIEVMCPPKAANFANSMPFPSPLSATFLNLLRFRLSFSLFHFIPSPPPPFLSFRPSFLPSSSSTFFLPPPPPIIFLSPIPSSTLHFCPAPTTSLFRPILPFLPSFSLIRPSSASHLFRPLFASYSFSPLDFHFRLIFISPTTLCFALSNWTFGTIGLLAHISFHSTHPPRPLPFPSKVHFPRPMLLNKSPQPNKAKIMSSVGCLEFGQI